MPEKIQQQLVSELAEDVARRYTIETDDAAALIDETLNASPVFQQMLQQAAAQEAPVKQIKRNKTYKKWAKEAKSRIYHQLRRYRTDDKIFHETINLLQNSNAGDALEPILTEVLHSHRSTSERMSSLRETLDTYASLLDDCRNENQEKLRILDVGCGIFPLLFPYAERPLPGIYHAADRDKLAIALLQAYGASAACDGSFQASEWELGERPVPFSQEYDVALLLKVVPVVRRLSPDLLSELAELPARKLVVTGCKYSMVRRTSIESRERRVVQEFAAEFGFTVVAPFETADEVGFLLER